MEASTQISKEDLGGLAVCSRVRIPISNPGERNIRRYESGTMKTGGCWRYQEYVMFAEKSCKQWVDPAQERSCGLKMVHEHKGRTG
jgi:hypothetical protein